MLVGTLINIIVLVVELILKSIQHIHCCWIFVIDF